MARKIRPGTIGAYKESQRLGAFFMGQYDPRKSPYYQPGYSVTAGAYGELMDKENYRPETQMDLTDAQRNYVNFGEGYLSHDPKDFDYARSFDDKDYRARRDERLAGIAEQYQKGRKLTRREERVVTRERASVTKKELKETQAQLKADAETETARNKAVARRNRFVEAYMGGQRRGSSFSGSIFGSGITRRNTILGGGGRKTLLG